MSILAAKCPCCGRDIGIEPDTEEYTCVFCGTKLKVSALKTEPVDGTLSDEKNTESKGARSDERSEHGEHRHSSEHHSSEHHSGEHHSSEHRSEHRSGSSSHHSSVHHRSPEEPREINAPELTEEEINEQLKLKAELKEELHSTVKQINELRGRRPKFETKKRTMTTIGLVGAVLACTAAAAIVFFADSIEDNSVLMIVSGAVALISLVMLITSVFQKRDIKKQKVRLEESILEKKQKRDVLIGRLNKINKTLHIHED